MSSSNSRIRGLPVFLDVVAILAILLLSVKAWVDVDYSYDTWMYHLPFAARLSGIVPATDYAYTTGQAFRYDGFPLLGEFLQGLLWRGFGRLQAANFVALGGLCLFVFFLRTCLGIPLAYATIGLLAIPLVQVHATACYVDLPANLALSALLLLTYLFLIRRDSITGRNLLLAAISAAVAVNTKLQLMPLAFIALCVIGMRLLLLDGEPKTPMRAGRRPVLLALSLMALPLIFLTPIKNLVLYHNPLFPVDLHLFGMSLHGNEPVPSGRQALPFVPEYLVYASPARRWLLSLLEVGIRPFTDPRRWSIDQYMPRGSMGSAMGGFSVVYVLFNLALLVYQALRSRDGQTLVAVLFVAFMSAVASVMPQSHTLRYYMFWMITLVSLNLYLAFNPSVPAAANPVAVRRALGLLLCGALALVITVTHGRYLLPRFFPVEALMQEHLDPRVLRAIPDGGEVCLFRQPWTFLYAAHFHPPRRYALKEGLSDEECGSYRRWPTLVSESS